MPAYIGFSVKDIKIVISVKIANRYAYNTCTCFINSSNCLSMPQVNICALTLSRMDLPPPFNLPPPLVKYTAARWSKTTTEPFPIFDTDSNMKYVSSLAEK